MQELEYAAVKTPGRKKVARVLDSLGVDPQVKEAIFREHDRQSPGTAKYASMNGHAVERLVVALLGIPPQEWRNRYGQTPNGRGRQVPLVSGVVPLLEQLDEPLHLKPVAEVMVGETYPPEKNVARELVWAGVEKLHPDPEAKLSMAAFPGREGLLSPHAVEKRWLVTRPNAILAGYEEDPIELPFVEAAAQALPVDQRERLHLIKGNILTKLPADKEGHLDCFDALWLDYKGGPTAERISRTNGLVVGGTLASPGLLAMTFSQTGDFRKLGSHLIGYNEGRDYYLKYFARIGFQVPWSNSFPYEGNNGAKMCTFAMIVVRP